jgi:pimeloyl-ACP methyl ester carboxylesterase
MTRKRVVNEGPGRTDGRQARERLLARIPLTERRRELAGVSTAVLEGGAGPPVVVLHGIGQAAVVWIRAIPGLAATRSVVLPDLPGQGDSEAGGGTLDAGRVLDWLGELIEATCPAPPVLVGQNIGGAIAARFASEHRARLGGLLLVDSFGLGPFRPAPRFALRMIAFQARATERTQDRLLGACMVDADGVRDRWGEDWDLVTAYALERSRTPSVKAAGRSLMKAFGLPAIPEAELDRIDVPVTLVWGREDPEARLRFGQAASARYGWPLHIIDRCGADPNVEHPEALLAAAHSALAPS